MNTSVAEVVDGLWFWTPPLRTIWNSEFSFPADPCISEPFRMFPPPLRACPSFYLPMKNLRVADVSLRSLLYRASHCCERSLTYGRPTLWRSPSCRLPISVPADARSVYLHVYSLLRRSGGWELSAVAEESRLLASNVGSRQRPIF